MLGKKKMKLLRQLLALCLTLGAFALAPSAVAADDLFLKGDAACTECHDETDGPNLLAIGKTRHGTQADSRAPTCTSCHGASKEHLGYKGSEKPPKPEVTFNVKSAATADARNGACQDCHAKDSKRSHWQGSTHQARDVTCAACHKVHVAKDAVRDRRSQSETCFACHKEQRTQGSKPSHHPVAEGKMACSDCHNVHGSTGPSLMKRNSVTETCYTCHMEKRGPFVHSHQPVDEDCSICHNAHGTTAASMLKSRPPFLCQTCHTPHGAIQPSTATGPVTNPGWWNGSTITQGRSCMNCHTQVHGSNNPSTALPTPQRLLR
jgi:DmsE family decaheme c-type cytochrome